MKHSAPMEPRIPRISRGTSSEGERPYLPRRALMYVPANSEKMLSKIPQLGADCICLDIEDGVALKSKAQARQNIRRILDKESTIDFGRSELTVRVNSLQSGLCHADLEAVFGGLHIDNAPSSIHLPKVDDPEGLDEFAYAFNSTYPHVNAKRIGLIIFIESARSLVQLKEICTGATKLKSKSRLVPEALVFGSDDYVADIGATRTEAATELTYARQKVVAVAKAFGMQAIDLVHIDFKDLEGLKLHSEEGARMGFTGKQVIHPTQIKVVQEAFKPSQERIEWANSLIKEFREHEAKGAGAFTFRGSMIDAPLVKQAQNIVQMANYL